jgi:hypothetical protein
MPTPGRIAALLAVTAACGFPRPRDVPGVSDDAGAGTPVADAAITDSALADVPDLPGVTLHVSTSGDDVNDGFALPVKTLKHAIGLAAANGEIKSIVLASGRYSTALGETFPYTLPANVTLIGPAGGGAILTGSNAEPGMIVDAGALRDLELEDFTVAITATGMATVANVHIRTSMLAMRAETAAKLTVDNLDVTGTAAACATGIELNGAADLVATILATRSLGITLDAKDQSTINIVKATIAGDSNCRQSVFRVTTNSAFMLGESLVDGGATGIDLTQATTSSRVTISNTTLRNLAHDAIDGSLATFVMTDSKILDNGGIGANVFAGSWSFERV